MSIEIKKSEKPVIYEDAKKMMEERLLNVDLNKSNELIWTLEHPDVYTAGTSYNKGDILDKSIKILETNRGGKITYHGPGQLICYFVIDLKKRKKEPAFLSHGSPHIYRTRVQCPSWCLGTTPRRAWRTEYENRRRALRRDISRAPHSRKTIKTVFLGV